MELTWLKPLLYFISKVILILVILIYIIIEWIFILSSRQFYENIINDGGSKTFAFFRIFFHTVLSPGGIAVFAAVIFLSKTGGKPIWISVIIFLCFIANYLISYITIATLWEWVLFQCVWIGLLFLMYKIYCS